MKKIILTAVISLCTPPLLASCLLSGYQANYTFYGKNGKALGNHTETLLLKTKNQYEFTGRSHMQVLWFKEQLHTTVNGQYANNQFSPNQYTFHESRKNTRISFKVQPGKSDSLSAILNCRAALIKQQNTCHQSIQYAPGGKSFPFSVDLSTLKSHTLKTALGTLRTIELVIPSKSGLTVRYWLAKKYAYLPVKIAGYKQGKSAFTEVISGYTPDNSAYCAVQ